jgi:2-oxoglutarate dehydrogenase E2 component (dihydrolipoamide succinyltransferase)
MADTKVIMPQMGESIFEGTLTKWLKKKGDQIKRDEPLFEISTDKVDSEIPAPASGVLQEVLVKEGQTVQINTVVAVIGDGTSKPADAPAAAESKADTKAESKESKGDAKKNASQAGSPAKTSSNEGNPGIKEGPAPVAGPVSSSEPENPPKPPKGGEDRKTDDEDEAGNGGGDDDDVRSSPLVRRLAKENNIDLSALSGKGTGINGRITKRDVMSFIEQGGAQQQAARPAASSTPSATPSIVFTGDVERVPLTAMRKAIADHMVMSRRTSAHVTTFFEVDCTKILQSREKQKSEFEKSGVKLTVTPFFVQAAANALRRFPVVNSSLDGDTVVYKRAINIGIAVNLEWGLIVPVVKSADEKNLFGLAKTINELGDKARNKKLAPDDVKDGTFTITNPGQYGALIGTPIINQPQVAIMGMGGIKKRAVVIDDAIAIRSMIMLSLSFDHRVIDGAVADQFMADIQKQLEGWTA